MNLNTNERNDEMTIIPGLDEMYAATRDGRIFSFSARKFLATKFDAKSNREKVTLTYRGKRQGFLVHTLIARTFIPNPDGKEVVMHINGNGRDNRVENLKWATLQERSIENPYYQNGVQAAAKARLRAVLKCDINDHNIVLGRYESACDAARGEYDDFSKNSLISRCAMGKVDSAYGYYWKWEE